jgi:ElaB/YqjD/DUF883 family membrane-anchored ribosome-binding protein
MRHDLSRFRKSHTAGADPFADRNGAASQTTTSQTEEIAYSAQNADDDLKALRKDLAGLRDALTAFISHAADRTAGAAQNAAATAKDQAAAAASKLAEHGAAAASEAAAQAKGAAAELEQMARRNPLGALAAAAAIGFVIGMMGRRR